MYIKVDKSHPKAMPLQSIGWVLGTPAKEIKKGDSLMWNFGEIEIVDEITKETPKTIVISMYIKGRLYERKLGKERLVCILS